MALHPLALRTRRNVMWSLLQLVVSCGLLPRYLGALLHRHWQYGIVPELIYLQRFVGALLHRHWGSRIAIRVAMPYGVSLCCFRVRVPVVDGPESRASLIVAPEKLPAKSLQHTLYC